MSETTDMLKEFARQMHEADLLGLDCVEDTPVWQAAQLIDSLEARLASYLSGDIIVNPKSDAHAQALIDVGASYLSSRAN